MTEPNVKWTIMAYINADNILANFAIESLKQLRNAASPNVTVIAEFDDNQQPDARLYLFNGDKKNSPLKESEIPKATIAAAKLEHVHDVDMTCPETLTEFVNFATKVSPTERYCLILWGHGIELLLDDDRRFATVDENSDTCSDAAEGKIAGHGTPSDGVLEDDAEPVARYLTTADLREALRATELATEKLGPNHPKTFAGKSGSKQENKPTLDIIGFDACSMSMLEVATAVQGYADYMIASQEDVPDVSFPYEKILNELKVQDVRGNVEKVCNLIPQLYESAFHDYITTPGTGVKGITMASLDVQKSDKIAGPLKKLSAALLQASYIPEKYEAILEARQNAKDFVFGILVDLCDFCKCLQKAFEDRAIKDANLLSACNEVQDALNLRDDEFVLTNEVSNQDQRCRGLSIYFPYRNQKDTTDNSEERLSKGTAGHGLKGTAGHGLKERAARIKELEDDFSKLEKLLKQSWLTEWMKFIRSGWSFILANKAPFKLDYHYSAEQCAANLGASGGHAERKAA